MSNAATKSGEQYAESGKLSSQSVQQDSEEFTFVIRRNGTITEFNPEKILIALKKAFLAVEGQHAYESERIQESLRKLTKRVVDSLHIKHRGRSTIHIESIQDDVELALMRAGYHKVARAYVLYREARAKERSVQTDVQNTPEPNSRRVLRFKRPDHSYDEVPFSTLYAIVEEACEGLDGIDLHALIAETERNLYDGMRAEEVTQAPILAARTLIEKEPAYSMVCANLLLNALRSEALTAVYGEERQASRQDIKPLYAEYFVRYVTRAVEYQILDPVLATFDLDRLGKALVPERDYRFEYLGLQTLYDRYFLQRDSMRYELPQAFFMRVAMGLAMKESDREAKAIQFYELMSQFRFMPSTPTLFNAGTLRPQLSSCFLTTIPDSLDGIFKSIKDNALLAKYSGGLGNDWSSVRGLGAHIRGTNGHSQGVVPFLKVANDTALAVNQGGKRKGAVCAYLETWHIDIEEFLELRKNTGDDRRRTHDMNTANWIPDLFMERVEANAEWTLFSPDEVPDLHHLYGEAFKTAYCAYEERALKQHLRVFKRVKAQQLWRKMLTMLFETGHPWITFKDPCNLCSPQQHCGVVHSSNLCTEITLNTSVEEVAVCNLGSINLVEHLDERGINLEALNNSVSIAMRMLDNVVDLNFYTIDEAKHANFKHRPVGLGIMGFQDALHKLKLTYASEAALEFADRSMEAVSFYALSSSADLAVERGAYSSFKGSLWSQGILPMDSYKRLVESRNAAAQADFSKTLDWDQLRTRIQSVGLRNSNCLAIAPTATISNIVGVSQSIEPSYSQLFVKANMSGDFTVMNTYLVKELKELGLWDEVMISDIKYYDGRLHTIGRIPQKIKQIFATAFEIDASWLVRAAARRQKWIDQSQSLNLYISTPSGKILDETYRLAWKLGLKTTYYLRASGASHVEKSTLKGTDGALNAVSATQNTSCAIDDPGCEACQ